MPVDFSGVLYCDVGDADSVEVHAMLTGLNGKSAVVWFVESPQYTFTESDSVSMAGYLDVDEPYGPAEGTPITLTVTGNYTSPEKSGSVPSITKQINIRHRDDP